MRAGRWFLESGIQEPSGGVARFHHTDLNRNAAISTEITGYTISTLVYFFRATQDQSYLESARRAASYLVGTAWDEQGSTIPFEPLRADGGGFSYFFDCGIIVRGLLALWRVTKDNVLFDRAKQIALSMAFDFIGDGCFHPIVELPEKQPLAYETRWSRTPGCYQLKSALAWRDIAEASTEPQPVHLWKQMLAYSLATHEAFLPGDASPENVMDRLHAYCYFLEAILAEPDSAECREALRVGIEKAGALLREIRPLFERSDVNAQLLRVRILAANLRILAIDEPAAQEEARAIGTFRREDGGFWFGRKPSGFLPYSNPVSTAFCAQGLEMYAGRETTLHDLI